SRGREPVRREALHQPLAYRVAHEIVDEAAVAEADPGLRRVYVDIHLFGVAFQEEQREWVGRRWHQVVIRRGERVQHQAVANQAPVDEDVYRIAIGLLHLRAREKAVEPEAPHGRVLGLRAA